MTGGGFKLDGGLFEAEASYDAPDKPAVFPEFQECIQRFLSMRRKSDPPGTTFVVDMELITA